MWDKHQRHVSMKFLKEWNKLEWRLGNVKVDEGIEYDDNFNVDNKDKRKDDEKKKMEKIWNMKERKESYQLPVGSDAGKS